MNGSLAYARSQSRGASLPCLCDGDAGAGGESCAGIPDLPELRAPLSRCLPTMERLSCGPPVVSVLTGHGGADPPGGACATSEVVPSLVWIVVSLRGASVMIVATTRVETA